VTQPQRDPTTFCEAPAAYIVETYFVLRMVIAVGAIGLPVALVGWAAVDPEPAAAVTSLSAFYYTPARGLFVGTLVAIGVALVAYRGYTRGENRLLNAAGTLAMVAALCPTEDPASPGATPVSVVHAVAAAAFFVLAALSIFFYGQQTLGSIPDPGLRGRYRTGYRILVALVLLLYSDGMSRFAPTPLRRPGMRIPPAISRSPSHTPGRGLPSNCPEPDPAHRMCRAQAVGSTFRRARRTTDSSTLRAVPRRSR